MYFKTNIKPSSRGSAAHGRGDKATLGRAGSGGGGSIVFYKEQETSLKEYMKETLKQMQISEGGTSRLISQLLCPGAACRSCCCGRGGGVEGGDPGTPRVLGPALPSRVGPGEAEKGQMSPGSPCNRGTRLWLDSMIL